MCPLYLGYFTGKSQPFQGEESLRECQLRSLTVQLNFLPVLICVPPGSSNGNSGLGWAQHSKQLFKEGQKNTVTLEP